MGRYSRVRKRQGQCFVEMIVGAMVLIPICFFGLNVITMVLANSANDSLAKNAARAAANQQTQSQALTAAQQCINAFPQSKIIPEVKLAGPIEYQDKEQVAVKIVMKVKMPTPVIPGMTEFDFQARAVEPIVGTKTDM